MTILYDIFPGLGEIGDVGTDFGFGMDTHPFDVFKPDIVNPNNGEIYPGGKARLNDPLYAHRFVAAALKLLHEYYTPERRETEGTPIEFDPNIETRIESIPQVSGTTIVTTRYQVQEMTIRFYREISLPEFDPNAF